MLDNLGLLLSQKAAVMTPTGVAFSFFSLSFWRLMWGCGAAMVQGAGRVWAVSHALQVAVLVNAASMQANQGHMQQVCPGCSSCVFFLFGLGPPDNNNDNFTNDIPYNIYNIMSYIITCMECLLSLHFGLWLGTT